MDELQDQGQQQRRAQEQQRGLDDRPRGEGIAHETEHQQRRTGGSGQDLEHPSRMLELIKDGLDKGEDVVERPVKDQAGGGIVQEHEEEGGHAVELDFRLDGVVLRKDGGGDDVDERHEKGEQVDFQRADGEQGVRQPQADKSQIDQRKK